MNRVAVAVALWSCCLMPTELRADAVVVTRAMSAPTIAEFFVERTELRVELEIGSIDLPAFRNLLPDSVYRRLYQDSSTAEQRLTQFFKQDFPFRFDLSSPTIGSVTRLAARPRIVRDELTGQPVADQPADGELVVYAELSIPIKDDPSALRIRPPLDDIGSPAASIGFACYHQGLPVTEFRYLAGEEILNLNWEDPWYSCFTNPNLRRQYDSPISVFLYVEPFEVRKEIVIRPVDLQRWIDLDINVGDEIPIAAQEELKQRVTDFMEQKHPVTIDGLPASGQLDRIEFLNRSLRKTGVIDPPQDLPAVSATLGLIYVYPIESLPQQVTLTWELFDDMISMVPAVATDEAGGLPATLRPANPELVWKNHLTNPTIPAMLAVPLPPLSPRLSLPTFSLLLAAIGLIGMVRCLTLRQTGRSRFWLPLTSIAVAAATWPVARVDVRNPFSSPPAISPSQSDEIVGSLLHNLYHAFDRHQESLIYDQLETAVTGELLSEIYLQTRQSLYLANQGGARVIIDQVQILENVLRKVEFEGIECRCTWNATGTVGHWGHLHQRRTEYQADFNIQPVDGSWKIAEMRILNQKQPELAN